MPETVAMNRGPDDHDGPPDDPTDLSRRDFLRRGAAPVVAFIALEAIGGLGLATGTSPKETKLSQGVVFPDPTLCIGCLTCEVICSQEHKRQGLSDVPRIRIFNDPTTQVADVIKQAYPVWTDAQSKTVTIMGPQSRSTLDDLLVQAEKLAAA